MTVTVYYWPPDWDTDSVGHASIMVDGGQPPGQAYLSAWPGSLLSIILVGEGAYHEYRDDIESEYNRKPAAVVLRKLDESAIKEKMSDLKKRSYYSFVSANCATQAGICLKAGVPLSALDTALSLVAPQTAYLTNINSPWTLYGYAKLLALKYA